MQAQTHASSNHTSSYQLVLCPCRRLQATTANMTYHYAANAAVPCELWATRAASLCLILALTVFQPGSAGASRSSGLDPLVSNLPCAGHGTPYSSAHVRQVPRW